MQNTIIKEFENDPRVITAVFEEGGRFGEETEWVKTFWSNYCLRGEVIWDATGSVARSHYRQPDTGLPFGRGFIIDRSGKIALPYFGHRPQLVVETIRRLLGPMRGDANGDSVIDVSDAVKILLYLFGGAEVPSIEALDANRDAKIDIADALYLLNYLFGGGPSPPP